MSKQLGRPTQRQLKHERRKEEQRKREEERLRAAHRKRNRTIGIIGGILAVLAIVVGLAFYLNANASKPGVETIVNANYPPIDGIYCDQQEMTAYHIHAHLTIYINGQKQTIPANTSIAPDGSCLYWLHTHDTTGVIHIEAPANRSVVLGNFFDIWSQKFPTGYPTQLDDATGWVAYVNGQPYTGDFHKIPLQEHTLITLAYNSPGITPDTTYSWGTL